MYNHKHHLFKNCTVGKLLFFFWSVGKKRFEESPQASMTDCQDSRRHGNEDNVGKASNHQQKLSRGALVVVEIVNRDDAGSPRCNEQHDES